jgi:CHAD domain-containing protein
VVKPARRLDELDVPERHELRKRLKTLRYAAEFFAPLYPGEHADQVLRELRRLQNVFGYLNDVAMAQELIRLVHARADDAAELEEAARRVLDWHEARADAAWTGVRGKWRRLKKIGPFWDA